MTLLSNAELDVTLEVEGTRYRVSQFGCSYALNSIPRARCTLAIGREASSGVIPAKLHKELTPLTRMSPCKIIFQGYGEYSPGIQWPDEETVIFEGYITGKGFQKSNGQIAFVVDMVHWLIDLDFSSALSKHSHVTNNSAYTFSALLNPAGESGLLPPEPELLMLTALGFLFNDETLSLDFWGEALKPFLEGLAKETHIRFDSRVSTCLGPSSGDNTRALEALSRIEGEATINDITTGLERSCYAPALALATEDSAIPSQVSEAISTAIGMQTVESYLHQTLWGKLVGQIAPQFLFSLVPQAERALIVPFVPGLRQPYCKSILASDYDHIALPAVITRPLRAVGVWAEMGPSTGLFGSATARGLMGLGGCFSPDTAETKDGLIRLINAPAWLQNVAATGYSAGESSGIRSAKLASTTTTPIEELDDELLGHKEKASVDDILLSAKEMYDRFARSYYIFETLRGREGQLSGKLRFDIAPGSTVFVEASGEPFLEGSDALEQSYYASVNAVSININAEKPAAGTGFSLTHARTAEENESDSTSIEYHPLYQTVFTGAPLIPTLGFAEEGDDCCFGD